MHVQGERGAKRNAMHVACRLGGTAAAWYAMRFLRDAVAVVPGVSALVVDLFPVRSSLLLLISRRCLHFSFSPLQDLCAGLSTIADPQLLITTFEFFTGAGSFRDAM